VLPGYVALTFDDGPHPGSTVALLRALKAGRARATFFIWAEHALQHPGLLRAQQAARMWIGNHTFSHPRLTQLKEPAAYQELARAQQAIRQITGQAPTLFRPPYGDTDERVQAGAAGLGLAEVLWTVDSRDWAGATSEEIVAAAATVQPGGIILLHDSGYQATIDAVPGILRGLADRGLRPGRIGYQLAADGRRCAVAVAP